MQVAIPATGPSITPTAARRSQRNQLKLSGHFRIAHASQRSATCCPVAASASWQHTGGDAASKLRLIMLRHADSQELRELRDHARPITQQGATAAQQLANLLYEKGWVPDLIICSSAVRTKQTLEEMCKAVAAFMEPQVQYLASLYAITALDGHTQRHLAECVLDAAADGANCVMCVGHNKGMEEAASSFAGVPVRLQTANAALLEVESATWAEAFADGARWTLVDVLVPAQAGQASGEAAAT